MIALFSEQCIAVEQHTKIWSSIIFIRSLTSDDKYKYYFEPRLRLVDNHYKFEEAGFLVGAGYVINDRLMVFIGDGSLTSRNNQGVYLHENRVWQQGDWVAIKNNQFSLISRTRLEERKNLDEAAWGLRFRERLLLLVPIEKYKELNFLMSDELFFNLNQPNWLPSASFWSQNRAFLGIRTYLSNNKFIDVGYMNQYLFTFPNQMSHILSITLNIM